MKPISWTSKPDTVLSAKLLEARSAAVQTMAKTCGRDAVLKAEAYRYAKDLADFTRSMLEGEKND